MASKRFRLMSSALICGSLLFTASSAQADKIVVAPLNSTPAGQTYGRWATQWYEWVLGIPSAENPLLDKTGQYCGQRQVDDVWFLSGSSVGPVVRYCNIPADKALFFPLINSGYFAFLSDPPDQRTEQFVRSQAACTLPVQISLTIDGKKVEKPERYFTGDSGSQSPIFNVQLPPPIPLPPGNGNIFQGDLNTIPELVLTPSAEQGYYIFLNPLPPGKHTIRWVARGCTPINPPQDITYNLTVAN